MPLPQFRLPELLTAACLMPDLSFFGLEQKYKNTPLLLNQVTESRSFVQQVSAETLRSAAEKGVTGVQAAKQGDRRTNLNLASLKETLRIFMR